MLCLLQVCAFAGRALPCVRELCSNDSTAQHQHRQHAMGLEACAADTALSVSSVLLHVSGGGGGDPLVHLLSFADFLCVAGAAVSP